VISFVGAGPGAADLITVRGARRLAAADIVIWAASLVREEVLAHCRPETTRFDSKTMTLEAVLAVYEEHRDAAIVRLHSGDPGIFSAIGEQIAWCLAHGRDFEIVPGVSAAAAAGAALGRELTAPGVAQSVVFTRLAHRTAASVPANESVAAYAQVGGTMVLFLSAARPDELQAELLTAGSSYDVTTPAVIASRVSWPEERIIRTSVGRLADDLRALGTTTTVLVLVGGSLSLDDVVHRSHVYDADYAHSFRARHDG
jgi:precorrin-4/cobalt-precorrin-4 C11-methyltransferase